VEPLDSDLGDWILFASTLVLGIALAAHGFEPSRPRTNTDVARIAVRLTAADGGPWDGEALVNDVPRLADSRLAAEWPERPSVMLWLGRDAGTAGVIPGWRVDPLGTEEGALVFEVERGERYVLLARGREMACQTRVVEVPHSARRIDVALPVRPCPEAGVMRVQTALPDPIDEPLSVWVALEDVDTGLRLLHDRTSDGKNGFTLRAPAGRYRVVAIGDAAKNDLGWPVPAIFSQHTRGTLHGERLIDVLPAETTTVEIVLRPTGSLEVGVWGEVLDADRDALRSAWPKLEVMALEACASRARLLLLRPESPPMELVHDFDHDELERAGDCAPWVRSLGTWRLGDRTQRVDRIPEGRADLVLRMPGGREVRRTVSVVGGRVTHVELRF